MYRVAVVAFLIFTLSNGAWAGSVEERHHGNNRPHPQAVITKTETIFVTIHDGALPTNSAAATSNTIADASSSSAAPPKNTKTTKPGNNNGHATSTRAAASNTAKPGNNNNHNGQVYSTKAGNGNNGNNGHATATTKAGNNNNGHATTTKAPPTTTTKANNGNGNGNGYGGHHGQTTKAGNGQASTTKAALSSTITIPPASSTAAQTSSTGNGGKDVSSSAAATSKTRNNGSKPTKSAKPSKPPKPSKSQKPPKTTKTRGNTATASSTVASETASATASATESATQTRGSETASQSDASFGIKTEASTASSAAPSASAGPGDDKDDQKSLTLNPRVIEKNLANDGQDVPTAGQVPALTSTNNFINFCMTQNVELTEGQQKKQGSCNPVPMGRIIAIDRIPVSKFVSPPNFGKVKANTAFRVEMKIKNLETGNFSNAQLTYYAAPAQVNGNGILIGHSHIVIEPLESLGSTKPLSPLGFKFFKGLNLAAQGGSLFADVTAGLPAGAYRMASINAATTHQPALASIAQHGAMDDWTYFTAE